MFRRLYLCCGCIFFWLVFAGLEAHGQEMPLTVIAAEKGPPDEMRMAELKSVLKGERQRWSDGTRVFIALFNPNTEPGSKTSQRIFNMTVDQMKKYWLALVFQGRGDSPVFFKTKEEVEAYVSSTPGAVGVVPQPTSVAKVISIDGRKTL